MDGCLEHLACDAAINTCELGRCERLAILAGDFSGAPSAAHLQRRNSVS
jgi:hypothetical protein